MKDFLFVLFKQQIGGYVHFQILHRFQSLFLLQIFLNPEISKIQILGHHLYQDQGDEEGEELALVFSVPDIISAFTEHEWYQNSIDREAKGEMGAEAAAAMEERIIRRWQQVHGY